MDNSNLNVGDFLKSTEYCDFHDPLIIKYAYEITEKYRTPQEKSVALFYWVRDYVLYRVGNWNKRASDTLNEREGTCTNKANLLVAFLRVLKIPAGYGVMKVRGRRYFGPIGLRMITKFAGNSSTHIYALVFLDNKWIKCDPSDDAQLCNNTYHLNYTTKIVEWDGKSDAVLNLRQKHIYFHKFPLSSIDVWMKKTPRHAKGIVLKIGNIYIKYIRHNPNKVSTTRDLEILFRKYLKKNYFFDYFYFLLISKITDFRFRIKKDAKNS